MICRFLIISVFVLQIFILGCDDNTNLADPPIDIQQSLHEDGRPAEWKSQKMKLSKTGFVASIGPYYYKDDNNSIPDYYSIEVSKSYKNEWRVYFSRDYHANKGHTFYEPLCQTQNLNFLIFFQNDSLSVCFPTHIILS